MNPAEEYMLKQKEPFQAIMLYLRSAIFRTLPEVKEKLSYGIPFYYFNKKPLCYLNILKGTSRVDLAFMKGFVLIEKFPELKDYNNRKLVRSLQIESLEHIDEHLLVSVLKEAALLTTGSRKAWGN